MSSGTIETAARHLALLAAPLIEASRSLGAFRRLMGRLGFSVSSLPPAYAALGTAAERLVTAVEALPPQPSAGDVFGLVDEVKAMFDAIAGLAGAAPPPGADAGAYAGEIVDRLVQLLIGDYVASASPTMQGILQVLDILSVETVPATATRPSFARTVIRWDSIPRVLSEPASLPERTYGWGTPDFDGRLLLEHLGDLFLGLNFPVEFERESKGTEPDYAPSATDEEAPHQRLVLPFLRTNFSGTPVEAGIALRVLTAPEGGVPGLVLEPDLPASFPLSIELHPKATLRLLAGTNAFGMIGLLLQQSGVSVRFPFAPGQPPVSGRVGVGFDFRSDAPMLIFGDAGGSRLEFGGASIDLDLHLGGADVGVSFGAELNGLKAVLSGGNSDGFVQAILGSGNSEVAIPLGIEWSDQGLRFKSSSAFEIAIAPHLSLGPIKIDTMTLSLAALPGGPPALRSEIGAGISGAFGPLAFVLQGIGIRADVTFANGNLGPLGIALGLKPPTGVGLSVDVAVVKGGGFLNFDTVREEYTGALELSIADTVSVTAVGIVTTRLPDGSKGFSLLLAITAEFGTGIQLSYGFTLLGIGGLLGLNRTMQLDVLANGLRSGAMDSILFPRNVVANAPRIISDLKQVFPAAPDRFLLGPMAKFGWGTPTLISISLGLVIEIPGNIALLGTLRIALPTVDAPLIIIQAAFLGAVEFDKKRIWFYATLFESRVLFATLDGGMGFVITYGDDPEFVISIGGFHPSFEPPALPFPAPQRITISLVDTSFARIRALAYMAVTSNTVQFGSRTELFFGFDSFNVQGHIAFDALIRFSPLYFIIEASASVALRVFGVDAFSIRLRFSLEGPTPYHAVGRGSISFLFFEFSADFDETFGERRDTTLPPIEALPLLAAEIGKIENWTARADTGSNSLVRVRVQQPVPGSVVVHPLGALRVSQRAVPLDGALAKIGAQTIADVEDLHIRPGNGSLAQQNAVDEFFALAQFEDLSDAEKLSRPSYERRPAGADLAATGEQFDCGPLSQRTARYEENVIDTFYTSVLRRFGLAVIGIFNHALRDNAAAKCALAKERAVKLDPFDSRVVVQSAGFAVTTIADNKKASGTVVFLTEAAAQAHVKAQAKANPAFASTLQVVPAHEMRSAA